MCQKSGRSERAGSQGPAKSAHNARSPESILSRTSWKREAKSVTLTHVCTLSLALSRSLAACGPAKRRPQQLRELVRGHDGSGCEFPSPSGAFCSGEDGGMRQYVFNYSFTVLFPICRLSLAKSEGSYCRNEKHKKRKRTEETVEERGRRKIFL